MSQNTNQRKTNLINKAAGRARRHLGGSAGEALAGFIRQFYRYVPPSDVLARTSETLFGAARAHWKMCAKRKPGQALIRVYNPTTKSHGWESEHTVVEVVTDDMPFLVDSVASELNRRNLTVHLVIHPIIHARRGKSGRILETGDEPSPSTVAESFLHLEVNALATNQLDEVRDGIAGVLTDVRAAVEDWDSMRARMNEVITDLGYRPGKAPDEAAELCDFLSWMYDDQFTFLGFRDYEFSGTGKKARVRVNPKSGLGVLRDPGFVIFRELRDLASMPPEVHAFLQKPDMVTVSKTDTLSTIHRPVLMDAIGVKRFDQKGKVTGLRMFVGLFTSAAYNMSALRIPLLRRKLQKTLERSGYPRASHDRKALLNILETYPRDELFQISEDELHHIGLGILHLQDRQRVALFIRRDHFERFASCLIYIPRDRYTTDLRFRLQDILEETFDGTVATHYSELGDSPLARLHVIVRTTPGKIPPYDDKKVEARLAAATRDWADDLQDALVAAKGEERGLLLARRYRRAFRTGYREHFAAATAVADIAIIEKILGSDDLGMALYRPPEMLDNQLWLKIYHSNRPIPLSEILPMLEHMGLKVMEEVPYRVRVREGEPKGKLIIQDFGLKTRDDSGVDLDAVRENFQATFLRVWKGEVESDGFNELVIRAGLTWREVTVLRAYCKYLRQVGTSFSQAYMEQTLANNPDLARMLVGLFIVRFDPGAARGVAAREKKILTQINHALDAVRSADEDRILRLFLNLVECTLRTNYFQIDDHGAPKPYVSFKLNSQDIDSLPLPRPMCEIWVYSPRVEGVHLRFGKVARGGLRWSDRREDFRTEILGLVKAQQVKNAVIVPVGSKGGFVVKRPPTSGDRDALQVEGIACYRTLITGMLDITDNLKGNRVVPPPDTVRLDGDDPYLVVAADKGTATFSDIANGLSADYGFWLGDAFASGGSVGYNHKEMGITARGAWESVKRHFRELGVDIQSHDFTVAGVGDMSGDVFGNGMLLSPHIKLIGAFNHRHIFIDPKPDPGTSFTERKRLFEMPRSSWDDYDPKLISKGGGVFDRSAKSIKLSPQIKRRFSIIRDRVTPNDLMRALLAANVDLMWFGGIGTYVKASDESHADAGDRATDAIRVNAADLRCRVIGEGANLGMTQRARVEFGLGGGRLNTDSVDNSAGVDCSDHEVNIKILLDSVVSDGALTGRQRNALLARMTDEVADLVLRDNYLQTQAITIIHSRAADVLDSQARLMRMLERIGRLDRSVEFLPDDEELDERAKNKKGLSRPEIAIIVSYSKIWIYDELINSDLPDDKYLVGDLTRYFPTPLQTKHAKSIKCHRLRREIIATNVTNSLVNRAGGAFMIDVMEKTGMEPPSIARAYVIAREVFAFRGMWDAIEGLDSRVPTRLQTAMLQDVNHLLDWITLWFLRHWNRPLDIGTHISEFAAGIAELTAGITDTLPHHYVEDMRERARPYHEGGVPEDLAQTVAGLVNLFSACDIVRLAAARKLPVLDVARLYFAVGTRFRLGRLRAATDRLEVLNHWQKLASAALIEETYVHQMTLTSQVMDCSKSIKVPAQAIDLWVGQNVESVARTDKLLTELWATDVNDLSMVAVASRQLRALTE